MTRRKRETSEDERTLFQTTLRDVRPFDPAVQTKPKPKPTKIESAVEPRERPAPRVRSGLDGRTAERLRRGQLEPQARLDLHGMTEAAAHRVLARFVQAAQVRGDRLVLVVTGKGGKPPPDDAAFDLELDRRARGVLKMMVPRWLAEPSLAPLVADARPAHRRHGGDGALYVYLRKR
jgi:DNA-nicking Smr family endonuclease